MPKNQSEGENGNKEKPDFELFNSMINGTMRPFLPAFSSEDHIKQLLKDMFSVTLVKTADSLLVDEDGKLAKYIRDGDLVYGTVEEVDGRSTLVLENKTEENLGQLFALDIPPPPDLKSEYFLLLIEDEHESIIRKASEVLSQSTQEKQVSFFANKNIIRLKELAGQAHVLSKRIKPKDSDIWDDPDSYIIDALKIFLIRSILYYQKLFQPFLKVPLQSEKQLKISLYEEKPTDVFMAEMADSFRNLLYERLGLEINTINSRPITSSDHQISLLKDLTMNKEWLNSISKEAVSNGFVGVSQLVFIMASDESYNEILKKIIIDRTDELVEIGGRFIGGKFISPKLISYYKSRIDIWDLFLKSWRKKHHDLPESIAYLNYLPRYSIDPNTRELEEFDLNDKFEQLKHEKQKKKSAKLTTEDYREMNKIVRNTARFIKLSELKKYFSDVIGIPLPSALFSTNSYADLNIGNISTAKNLRPSQKAKLECRDIAESIWKDNPDITIADMIRDDGIVQASKKKNGALYTEKTVRDWIKDLCPNRSPGRPKKSD
jgi:hypothetical protein